LSWLAGVAVGVELVVLEALVVCWLLPLLP
jgi:hypothetical protein